MVPVRAALPYREAVGVRGAGLDAVEADPRDAVLAVWKDQTMPVDRAVLGKRVSDVDDDILALLEAKGGPGDRSVDGECRPLLAGNVQFDLADPRSWSRRRS